MEPLGGNSSPSINSTHSSLIGQHRLHCFWQQQPANLVSLLCSNRRTSRALPEPCVPQNLATSSKYHVVQVIESETGNYDLTLQRGSSLKHWDQKECEFATGRRTDGENGKTMPPFPAPQIKDTAGAGDWMTARLLTILLQQKDTIGIDPFLASIEYGQRLSAISIAFDSPSGALTTLGSSIIEQIANGTASIQGRRDSKMRAATRAGCTWPLSNYCELCLT